MLKTTMIKAIASGHSFPKTKPANIAIPKRTADRISPTKGNQGSDEEKFPVSFPGIGIIVSVLTAETKLLYINS
jgi:hypothetical protein